MKIVNNGRFTTMVTVKDRNKTLGWPDAWFLSDINDAHGVLMDVVQGESVPSLCIQSPDSSDDSAFTFFSAVRYRQKRLRFSGFFNSSEIKDWSGVWIKVLDSSRQIVSADFKYSYEPHDWKVFDLIVEIPIEAQTVMLGFSVFHGGAARITKLKLQVMDNDTSILHYPKEYWRGKVNTPEMEIPTNTRPGNMNLLGITEKSLGPWYITSNIKNPFGSPEHARDGLSLKIADGVGSFESVASSLYQAAFAQTISAASFAGRRIAFSGSLKCQDVVSYGYGRTALYVRVDGPGVEQKFSALRFDDMFDRFLMTTIDWTRCKIVIDIPSVATAITFGVMFKGKGSGWFKELDFCESVEDTTDNYSRTVEHPVNLDFAALVTDASNSIVGKSHPFLDVY